jgi:hypothetical protein
VLVIDWAELKDVYGPASQVPALLSSAATSDDDPAWDELWGRLCHQGTVASASYAALPLLSEMGRGHQPAGYVPAVHLAAGIVASEDGPEATDVVRARYAAELAELRDIADRCLPLAADDIEFVYGLQALMAFENGGPWQRNLHVLADGEASLECPSCAEDLLLNLDAPPFEVRSFAGGDLVRGTAGPAEPQPSTPEDRLLVLARANGRETVEARLRLLFGTATCPCCHATFDVPAALV